jgi:ribonucleoside-diphosphate reductase alpha chain
VLVQKFSHMRFEPSGVTSNPEIPLAKSIMDYIFRWLDRKFGDDAAPVRPDAPGDIPARGFTVASEFGQTAGFDHEPDAAPRNRITLEETERLIFKTQSDSPPCPECGSVMVRNGSCYKCLNCASTSGCS